MENPYEYYFTQRTFNRKEENKLCHSNNSEFWLAKIKRNMERDNEVNKALYGLGWKVLRFWSKDVLSDINTCINIIDDCVDSNKD